MTLPKKIAQEDLHRLGYILVAPNVAKHKSYNSYRTQCKSCKYWFIQVFSDKCKKCH